MLKGTILRGKSHEQYYSTEPCAFCDSRENVQLFAGLRLCGNCQENIRITNPGMFEANDQIEQKAQD